MKPLKVTMSAFGPYAEEVAVDFGKYLNGLYIITGDTGAGKTTIFDAITFALYGEASTRRRENSMLRSDFAKKTVKTFVELEFEYRDQIYKIYRNPRYKREGLKTEESAKAELTYPDGSVRTGVKEVNAAVEELLGIDCGQFTQIAMIAQGDFLKLLLAGTEERGRIFRKIFNTDFYRRFQDRLKASCADKRRAYESAKENIDREMKNIISGEDISLFDWSRADEFLEKADDIIKKSESKNRQLMKDEAEIKKKIDMLAASISAGEKNNALIQSLMQERRCLEEMKSRDDDIKNKKKTAEMYDNMSLQIMPLYKRLGDREKSAAELNAVIDEQRHILEGNEKKLGSLEKTLEKEKNRHKDRERITENIAAVKNELLYYSEIKELKAKRDEEDKKVSVCKEQAERLSSELKNIKETISDLDAKLSEMKMTEADSERAGNKLAETKKMRDRLQKALLDCEIFENAKDAYNVITEKYLACEERFKEKTDLYNEQYSLFLREQAGIMAQTLNDGEPCPVCGSLEHPRPAETNDSAPAEQELDVLKQETELLSNECRRLAENAASKKSEYEKISSFVEAVLNDIGAEISDDVTAAVQNAKEKNDYEMAENSRIAAEAQKAVLQKKEYEKKIDSCRLTLSETETRLNEVNSVVTEQSIKIKGFEERINALEALISSGSEEDAREKISALESERDDLDKRFAEADEMYNNCVSNIVSAKKVIEKNEPITVKAIEGVKRDRLKVERMLKDLGYTKNDLETIPSAEEIAKIKDETDRFFSAAEEIKGKIKALEDAVTSEELADLNKLEEEKKELMLSLEGIAEITRNLHTEISINKKVKKTVSELVRQMQKDEKEYSMLLNISQTACGELPQRRKIAFEQYIQSAYFKSILNEANKRFTYMTNGRFELVKRDMSDDLKSRGGLEIDVFDNYTGKSRDVKSLSGGESFKASLCMALGLSEVIQRSSGGVKLDSMFVDEGFGVLDSESLEQAIDVLNSLSQSDRMVGIISHISELKDKIDKKIIVKRSSGGSSIKMIY